MLGVDSTTFQPLDGWAHVEQSISDILRTAIGTRVSPGDVTAATGEVLSIREYGAGIGNFVDQPLNDETVLSIMVTVVEALRRWEPRVELKNVVPAWLEPGHLEIALTLVWIEAREQREVTVML